MSERISNKFQAVCLGAAIGEAIGMPAEGMTPQKIAETLGSPGGYANRPASPDFSPLAAGHSARQTEALLSVLATSNPLPDLQEFAFTLKQAFSAYPEKWPLSTTFPWPPFPDGGHYTFSFAIPASRLLYEERATVSQLVDWMHTLTPSSAVWRQSIWLYLRLLNYLYGQNIEHFDPDQFLTHAAQFVREAERYFPGEFKIRRRMQVTEPMMDDALERIAASCGNISNQAEDVITFVGVVFYRHFSDMRASISEAARLGGSSEATCFYLGSLHGALGGMQALPEDWVDGYGERTRVEAALERFESHMSARNG